MRFKNKKGFALITLIIAIVLMTALGAGIYSFTTSSTFSELLATRDYNAYQLAKAGMRYAVFNGGSYTNATYCMSGDQCFTINGTLTGGYTSIGRVNPSTFLSSNRQIAYLVPSSSGFSGGSTGGDDFSDAGSRPFVTGPGEGGALGDYTVSDGALNITSVNPGQQTFFSIFPTSTSTGSDYEVQVKIIVDGGVNHMAGITFRKQTGSVVSGRLQSYGVSFLRGDDSSMPNFGSININNDSNLYIVLWGVFESGAVPSGIQSIIAYKIIPTNSGILSSGTTLAPWSTLLVRVREETVGAVKNNAISVYYADADIISIRNGNASPIDYIRKGSGVGGVPQVGCENQLPWPPNNINEWTDLVDYFTVVQWDYVNPANGTLSSDGTYTNAIVKTIGATDLDFSQPLFEFGLHAFGNTTLALQVSFDDFAYRISGAGGASCSPITRILTVASTNPSSGVAITVSPNDNNVQGNGTTPFTRTYNNNTSVTLTAPATASGNNFGSWTGCDSTDLVNRSCAVTMAAAKTVTANFTVVPTVTSLVVTGPANVNESSTAQYTATATWSDGSTTDVTNLATWSENSSRASIDSAGSSRGLLTASSVTSDQSVRVTATYNGVSGYIDITIVNKVVTSIAVTGPANVNESSTAQYTAAATWSDGSTTDVTNLATWSENSSRASIDSGGSSRGLLTASSVTSDQSVRVTATYNGVSGYIDITIHNL